MRRATADVTTIERIVCAAGLSGDVVRIGVLNDQSGLYSDINGLGEVMAVRLAADPAKRAFRPLEQSECPYAKKS